MAQEKQPFLMNCCGFVTSFQLPVLAPPLLPVHSSHQPKLWYLKYINLIMSLPKQKSPQWGSPSGSAWSGLFLLLQLYTYFFHPQASALDHPSAHSSSSRFSHGWLFLSFWSEKPSLAILPKVTSLSHSLPLLIFFKAFFSVRNYLTIYFCLLFFPLNQNIDAVSILITCVSPKSGSQ